MALGAIETMLEHRSKLMQDLRAVTEPAAAHNRALSTNEAARFEAIKGEVLAQDQRIDDEREVERRARRVAEVRAETAPAGRVEGGGPSGWAVTGEPTTYQRDDHRTSWIRDMATVALGRDGASEARGRLQANNQQARTELRALSATDGAGGDFVPPVWLVSEFIALARASRPTADRVLNQPLPAGTDQLNVPKLITGTAVAEQAVQNSIVQNTDATTGTATAAVSTLAGAQTISVQMLEQSPLNVDQMLLQDLLFDYAAKVDLFVLNNNAANKYGILNTPGVLAQVYTDAAPSTSKLYGQIAQAVSAVQQNRFSSPDTIVMHPRRWAAFLSAADSSGRPHVLASSNGPVNAMGIAGAPNTGGIVGNIQGLDVITDAQIPTNLGAGTNQDVVIVMRASDFVLYEGAPRAEAFRDTKADSLSIYLRMYNYVAVLSRFPKSINVVSGSGLITPVFGA